MSSRHVGRSSSIALRSCASRACLTIVDLPACDAPACLARQTQAPRTENEQGRAGRPRRVQVAVDAHALGASAYLRLQEQRVAAGGAGPEGERVVASALWSGRRPAPEAGHADTQLRDEAEQTGASMSRSSDREVSQGSDKRERRSGRAIGGENDLQTRHKAVRLEQTARAC